MFYVEMGVLGGEWSSQRINKDQLHVAIWLIQNDAIDSGHNHGVLLHLVLDEISFID